MFSEIDLTFYLKRPDVFPFANWCYRPAVGYCAEDKTADFSWLVPWFREGWAPAFEQRLRLRFICRHLLSGFQGDINIFRSRL